MKKPITICIICVFLIGCVLACFYYLNTHDLFKATETTEQTYTTTSTNSKPEETVNTEPSERIETTLESTSATSISIEETSAPNLTEKETEESTENTTPISGESLFQVSKETTNLPIGTIARHDGFYVSLNCVRSLNKVQTAINSYSEDISSNQEVIYPIIEIYNYTNNIKDFSKYDIAVYVDSVQAAKPDTYMLVGIDDFDEYQSYSIDAKKTCVVVDGFVVEKGWTDLTVFCGDVSWTLKSDEISKKPYSYKTQFEEELSYSFTESGSTLYSDGFELVFDGFDTIKQNSYVDGKKNYAIFMFTIKNTSSDTLDCGLWGYEMRAYMNSRLLEDADYITDKIVSGHSNIYNVDEIRPGMTAKIYVCFEIPEKTGIFECYFDTGYIGKKTIAHVIVQN
ncbi:MAG: hypothetical protein IK106_02315 [Clostridiales bacterium]|nr:hypothetical protein [Clostridiales bacterium]